MKKKFQIDNSDLDLNQSPNTLVAIFCALQEEFEALQKKIINPIQQIYANFNFVQGQYKSRPILLIETGIGLINAASAVTAFVMNFDPKLMLFAGVAGAIDPSLKVGDVIIAKDCIYVEGLSHKKLEPAWPVPQAHYKTDYELLNNIPAEILTAHYQTKLGTLLSSDFFPAPENFKELGKDFAALAIDMETAAFYQINFGLNKPCLAIRSISNSVSSSENEVIDYVSLVKAAYNAADCCFHILDSFFISDDQAKKIVEKSI